MGIFGRRRRPARYESDFDAEGVGLGIASHVGIPQWDPPAQLYTAGWRGIGYGAAPSEQVGAYDGTVLNALPAIVPGVQLHQGVEGMNSGWYYPTVSAIPGGSPQEYRPTPGAAGGQRYGSRYSGPIGPLSVRRMRQRVAQASIEQTALMAEPWAGVLAPNPGQ